MFLSLRGTQCRGNLGGPPTNVIARHPVPWQSRWGCGQGPGACVVFPSPLYRDCFASLAKTTILSLRGTPLSVIARHGVPWQSRWGCGQGPGACAVFPCPLSAEIAALRSQRQRVRYARKDTVGFPRLLRRFALLAMRDEVPLAMTKM
jgi:hypothetical protein